LRVIVNIVIEGDGSQPLLLRSVNFEPMGKEGVIQVFDERVDAGFPLPFA
jgi:hypothetical protein